MISRGILWVRRIKRGQFITLRSSVLEPTQLHVPSSSGEQLIVVTGTGVLPSEPTHSPPSAATGSPSFTLRASFVPCRRLSSLRCNTPFVLLVYSVLPSLPLRHASLLKPCLHPLCRLAHPRRRSCGPPSSCIQGITCLSWWSSPLLT